MSLAVAASQLTGASQVRLSYVLHNADIAAKRAHISGPRSYMYIVDRKTEPAELDITMPDGWKAATSLA